MKLPEKYQIGGDSTKLGGVNTKNMWGKIYFLFYILFSNKGKSVILVLSFKRNIEFPMSSLCESKPNAVAGLTPISVLLSSPL
jgi:hypothetical protein